MSKMLTEFDAAGTWRVCLMLTRYLEFTVDFVDVNEMISIRLPEDNFYALKRLIKLFKAVYDNEAKNQMSLESLAIVLSPLLTRPRSASTGDLISYDVT
jgi:hypothetical protein